jgi:glycosyltransferase involved in cell wall biosynthesis
MHIAIYLPSLRGGGAERVMVNLANAMAERGHKVDLVLVEAVGPYLADVSAKVTIVDLHSRSTFYSLPGLIGYLRRHRPDSVLSVLSSANVVALVARLLSGRRFRLVVSERSTFSAERIADQGLKSRFLHFIVPIFYPLADAIVTVSKAASDDLVASTGLPPERVSAIYNFTEVGRANSNHDANDSSPVQHGEMIFAAGRLTKAKGFGVLVSAFAMLRATRNVRLVIAGEGELRAALEQQARDLGIEEHVSLPGFLRNPDQWMRRASLFVLSSAWEGFPNVLLEAMACGARVVSTDCPSGPAEILENGKWGALVPVGDAEALFRAMAAALDDQSPPDTRLRAADFTAERTVDAYLSVLSDGVA